MHHRPWSGPVVEGAQAVRAVQVFLVSLKSLVAWCSRW